MPTDARAALGYLWKSFAYGPEGIALVENDMSCIAPEGDSLGFAGSLVVGQFRVVCSSLCSGIWAFRYAEQGSRPQTKREICDERVTA